MESKIDDLEILIQKLEGVPSYSDIQMYLREDHDIQFNDIITYLKAFKNESSTIQ